MNLKKLLVNSQTLSVGIKSKVSNFIAPVKCRRTLLEPGGVSKSTFLAVFNNPKKSYKLRAYFGGPWGWGLIFKPSTSPLAYLRNSNPQRDDEEFLQDSENRICTRG